MPLRRGSQAISVDAVGFPRAGDYSPVLEDAVLRRAGRAPLPTPIDATPAELLQGQHDGTLVRVRGRVVERFSTGAEDILLLQADSTAFSAHLERRKDAGPLDIGAGSIVDVTGVSALLLERAAGSTTPRGVRLLLASPQAITVVTRPHWLTLQRAGWLVGGLAAVVTRWARVARHAAPARTSADDRARQSPGRGGSGEPRQERVRGQHEPRGPHADMRS